MYNFTEELFSYDRDYLYVIYDNPNIDITSLNLGDIDRGVMDFEDFKITLLESFPKIKSLRWSQNYSFSVNGDKDLWIDFINFIKGMKLTELYLDDTQSSFFKCFNRDELLNVMPINSKYTIISKYLMGGKIVLIK